MGYWLLMMPWTNNTAGQHRPAWSTIHDHTTSIKLLPNVVFFYGLHCPPADPLCALLIIRVGAQILLHQKTLKNILLNRLFPLFSMHFYTLQKRLIFLLCFKAFYLILMGSWSNLTSFLLFDYLFNCRYFPMTCTPLSLTPDTDLQ